jgi:hypothetical protein
VSLSQFNCTILPMEFEIFGLEPQRMQMVHTISLAGHVVRASFLDKYRVALCIPEESTIPDKPNSHRSNPPLSSVALTEGRVPTCLQLLSLDCIARFEASADGQTKLFQSEFGLFRLFYLFERRARTRGGHAGPRPPLPEKSSRPTRIRRPSRGRQDVRKLHTGSRRSPKLYYLSCKY